MNRNGGRYGLSRLMRRRNSRELERQNFKDNNFSPYRHKVTKIKRIGITAYDNSQKSKQVNGRCMEETTLQVQKTGKK